MAYLNDKEQYFTYKGWPDLTLSLQPGSDEVELKGVVGYAIEINDNEIGVFLQFDKDTVTGFKNPSEAKQCFVKLYLGGEKKLFRDNVKVSRLEKTIATYFKSLAASKKYFQGTLYISTASRSMNQFEMGDDTLLPHLFEAKFTESETTFEVPTEGTKKSYNNFAKTETEKERLEARLLFYRSTQGFPFDETLFFVDSAKGMAMLSSEKKQFVMRLAFFKLFSNCPLDIPNLIALADYLYDK